MYGGQEGSATKASAYYNQAANTLHHGGCQYRIVTAPSQQPHLFMTHMIKLILDTSITDMKRMNLPPCSLFSAEILMCKRTSA